MSARTPKSRGRISISTLVACTALSFVLSGCESKPDAPKPAAPPAAAGKTAAPAVDPAKAAAPVPGPNHGANPHASTVKPMVPDPQLAKKFVGKYLNKKYPEDYTELKKDGTFESREGSISLTGKYFVEGDRLLLSLPNGSGSLSKIDGKGITDSNGDIWKRQK